MQRLSAFVSAALFLVLMAGGLGVNSYGGVDPGWTSSFNLENCTLSPNGTNDYFYLEPGYKLVLEGQEDGETIQLNMTVLDGTRNVDGVDTRIVEEMESENGELIEISRNYFVMCAETGDIFYFGEEVDIYESGKVVGHEGAWLAGEAGTRAGMIIPANPVVGMKYYQEVAPGVAEDRAEVISLDEVVDTPAGRFENVLKIEETNPLEGNEKEFKFHAPEIGLIQDADLKLVAYFLPEVRPDVPELKSQVQSAVVEGKTIQVELNSSSAISEFALQEENKRVTFKTGGATGTEGTTEISIGSILEGPYTVSIDGQATDNFEVTPAGASSGAMIKISHTSSAHAVTITGTNVVPEFPLHAIWIISFVTGVVALISRSRTAGNFRSGN